MQDPYQESHLKVMRLLEENPSISQRELAETLGVSLGKVNYCLKALADKGWVKVQNFKNNKNKRVYAYLLTPAGMAQKADMAVQFLKRKVQEYEALKEEIALLQEEASKQGELSLNFPRDVEVDETEPVNEDGVNHHAARKDAV